VEHLVKYCEEHIDELVEDLLPALREADAIFRECDPTRLHRALYEAIQHFGDFLEGRDLSHLDSAYQAIESLWPRDRFYFSSLLRIFLGLEELLSFRGQKLFSTTEGFLNALRAYHASQKEVLCVFSDRIQQRYSRWDQERFASVPPPHSQPAQHIEGRLPSDPSPLVQQLGRVDPVGRTEELRRLWGALRKVAAHEAQQLVGIKGQDGIGKSTLIAAFLERVEKRLGRSPAVLFAKAPRLFNLPSWPIAALVRDAFGALPGMSDNPERVRKGLKELVETSSLQTSIDVETLNRAEPFLLHFIGEEIDLNELPPRTIGIWKRRSLIALFKGLALQSRTRTGIPLFLVLEDVSGMDNSSWELLYYLLRHIQPPAPMMILLSYDGRFSLPSNLARMPEFTEVELRAHEMKEGESIIDALLQPNELQDQTRLRLNAGAQGSPLLLYEAIRQLVEDGIIGRIQNSWLEINALPEGVVGDLGNIVERRRRHLDPIASQLIEIISVIEDSTGGSILEEVARQRSIFPEALMAALGRLRAAGLLDWSQAPQSITALSRHALVRDEIYRQMSPERRRSIHEDAAEVLQRLPGVCNFPSLAAGHLAFAGRATQALKKLLESIDRALSAQALNAALELSSHALGLLKKLSGEEHKHYARSLLERRESIYARMGRPDLQGQDLKRLQKLCGPEPDIQRRLGILALLEGHSEEAEERLNPLLAEDKCPLKSRIRLALALNCWQKGEREKGQQILAEALNEAGEEMPLELYRRFLFAQGLFAAAEGQSKEALHALFEAWRLHREMGDLWGEALSVRVLAEFFKSSGRLLDSIRLLRRAEELLQDAEDPQAKGRILLDKGRLHAMIGDFDEADRHFSQVQRLLNQERDLLPYIEAIIEHGSILVHRGQFDDAMAVLAQCIKKLGHRAAQTPAYIDALVALAMNFTLFAPAEKLVLGGLRYASDAADRATEIAHHSGLIHALVIQVRGLVSLGRLRDARQQMKDLDEIYHGVLQRDHRLERLRHKVEMARFHFLQASGDEAGADKALLSAWNELEQQLKGIRGSGYERGFLTNIFVHREIIQNVGSKEAS